MNPVKKFMQLIKRDSTTDYSRITIRNGGFIHQLTTNSPTNVANALLAQAALTAEWPTTIEDFPVRVIVLRLGTKILAEPEWHVLVDNLAPSHVELVSSSEVERPEPNIQEYEYIFRKRITP